VRRRAGSLERQRQRIAAALLSDPSRSNYGIAREVGCSHHTVAGVRGQMPAVECQPPTARTGNPGSANLVPPAGPGNLRAATHGAHSEALVAPLRVRFLERLREQYPAVGEELLRVQAHRAAQLELLTAWTDEHGIVRSARTGEVYGAAVFAERLASAFERQADRLRELQREASRVDPFEALDAHVAELTAVTGGGP
jgi:hypothetical protein